MTEDEFQAALARLREEWGGVHVDPDRPGYLIADNDPLTGLLAGRFAPLFGEIINRALTPNPTTIQGGGREVSDVTVTQADRDAATMFRAEALRSLMAGEPGGWKDTPDDKLVQAFARHRVQSQTVSTGEIGELVADVRNYVEVLANTPSGLSMVEWSIISNTFLKAADMIERLSALSGEGG